MDSIPGYISPENKQDVDDLMKPLRDAQTRKERDEARREINAKVTNDTKNARDRMN